MSFIASGFSGATTGTAVAPGVGTAVGAVAGVVASLTGSNKEAQREQYLNQQAALATQGNVGALKLIYDWANGVSATEYDGTNRGNEPTQSRQFAQQILLRLQQNGISYNPNTGQVQFPGISSLGFASLSSIAGGNSLVALIEMGLLVVAAVVVIDAVIGKK